MLIKECTANILKDETHFTSTINTRSEEDRKFSSIRKCFWVLATSYCRGGAYSNGLRPARPFFKGRKTDMLHGFFKERGVIGTLKAKQYGKADLISPFLGEIVDRFCDRDNTPITSSYMYCVEVMHATYQFGRTLGCRKLENQELRKMIVKFKEKVLRVYAR